MRRLINRNGRQESKRSFFKKGAAAVLILVSCLYPAFSNAQCAMCRAALESSDNTQKAAAVNDGIVYLMIIPYLLVGVIGFAVYRSRQKAKLLK